MNLSHQAADIARRAHESNPNDVSAAATQALAELQKLPDWQTLTTDLIVNAVRGLVHQARQQSNVQIRRDAGYYGQSAKVLATSETLTQIATSVYDYCLGGRTLGNLTGAELPAIAAHEEAAAAGHGFNASLCRWLQGIVPAGETVKQAVPEARIREVFQRLRKQSDVA